MHWIYPALRTQTAAAVTGLTHFYSTPAAVKYGPKSRGNN